jgi:hypothetical protein
MNKIPPETIQYLRSLKIGFEILPTVRITLFSCERQYSYLILNLDTSL